MLTKVEEKKKKRYSPFSLAHTCRFSFWHEQFFFFGLFKFFVTRKGKPKIGLNTHKNGHSSEGLRMMSSCNSRRKGWSFGLWVSVIKDTALRAQVLAVVFIHFILSGILALEANMLT